MRPTKEILIDYWDSFHWVFTWIGVCIVISGFIVMIFPNDSYNNDLGIGVVGYNTKEPSIEEEIMEDKAREEDFLDTEESEGEEV